MGKKSLLIILLSLSVFGLFAQNQYELNNGWRCAAIKDVQAGGENISSSDFVVKEWMPAVVPGTVLTSMLENKLVPDPFYGMNNERIPDIYNVGRDYYTYWFVKDFKETKPANGGQVWLHFRGVNYSSDIYLNGKKVNKERHYGMFLRQSYNITALLNKNGDNRLAVIVYPADEVGNPNGGQGGDGTIAKGVAHQYTAGWDWIQPIRDRNTGIWDKVTIEKTQGVNVSNPHVVTLVPGKRQVNGPQAPAIIQMSAELQNIADTKMQGILQYKIDGKLVKQPVTLQPKSTTEIKFKDVVFANPKLWWPNGYGPQNLYPVKMQFVANGVVSDEENLSVGIREIQATWNETTRSKQIAVNGQKIFIKGGNWIISDAMLRFTDERYDAEIRYHQDMNLNLIRIWGGALPERPEFYKACDKYGLLVMQDFWMSGDCNGRWLDPMKKEDQWTRRKYPDDHGLFLRSAADMVKMMRNHASLAIWCGGNEITPPEDILVPLRDSILAKLDGTRWFVDYSNSDSMSYNFIGGNGDGPYGVQNISTFWQERTFPFNSEIGSVGVGDYVSLERFIPKENLVAPKFPGRKVDSVWNYHKYIGYDAHIAPYGAAKDAKDFAMKAQLVNYDQYRALAEGFSSHIWDWYTGFIIWKTQNPWTAMRGQMYDYYLDPNACLYGLRSGSQSLHAMCNPVAGTVMMVNNGFEAARNIMLAVHVYDMDGKDSLISQAFTYIEPSSVKKIFSIKEVLDKLAKDKGAFLSVQLLDENQKVLSDNFYWQPDANGQYSGLQAMPKASVKVTTKQLAEGKLEITVSNPSSNGVAFFNRVALVNAQTKQRILPAFYSDNYFSILPKGEKKIIIEYTVEKGKLMIGVEGWNVAETFFEIQ